MKPATALSMSPVIGIIWGVWQNFHDAESADFSDLHYLKQVDKVLDQLRVFAMRGTVEFKFNRLKIVG